jgi:hypothetical protein
MITPLCSDCHINDAYRDTGKCMPCLRKAFVEKTGSTPSPDVDTPAWRETMNRLALAKAIREYARAVQDDGCNEPSNAKISDNDTYELLIVLARVLEGKQIEKAFGAPGDWGYGTPIGDAIAGRVTHDLQTRPEWQRMGEGD